MIFCLLTHIGSSRGGPIQKFKFNYIIVRGGGRLQQFALKDPNQNALPVTFPNWSNMRRPHDYSVKIGSTVISPDATDGSRQPQISTASPILGVEPDYLNAVMNALDAEYTFPLLAYTVPCDSVASLPPIEFTVGQGFGISYKVLPKDYVFQMVFYDFETRRLFKVA